MKAARYGETDVAYQQSKRGWYVMVGDLAVCSYHGAPHLHRHSDPAHPDHLPRFAVDPTLGMREVLGRVRALCDPLPREPTLEELLEVLR